MMYFKILFFVLFLFEVRYLNFRHPRDKYIWIGILLAFGYFGYFLFLAFKRRLVVKRKFNPNFNGK